MGYLSSRMGAERYPESVVWYLVQRFSHHARSFCSKWVDVVSGADVAIPT